MAFKFPDFTGTYCHAVAACGSVKSKDKRVLSILKSQIGAVRARYKVGRHHGWLLVMLGGGKDGHHFHMEAMTDFLAKKRGLADENCGVEEVQELLSPMIGRTIHVTVSGMFLVPVADLPEMSLVGPLPTPGEESPIKTTGSTLEIRESLIPYMSWMLIKDDQARVDLTGHLIGKIDEDYLNDFFVLLRAAFRAYAFGEVSDASKD
jgi:hypothetical protein